MSKAIDVPKLIGAGGKFYLPDLNGYSCTSGGIVIGMADHNASIWCDIFKALHQSGLLCGREAS
ncbi:MAG TPA: hypothetical protein VIE65_07405 [Methylobacter sp.]